VGAGGRYSNHGSDLEDSSSKTVLVQVLQQYSKHPGMRQRLERARWLSQRPATRPQSRSAPPRVHKAKVRLTPVEIQHLINDYELGFPSTHLMKKYGLGKGTVLNILSEAGVPLRNQGLSTDQLAQAIELYKAGRSLKAIGHKFGCDAETVRKALKTAGVTLRKPWDRN